MSTLRRRWPGIALCLKEMVVPGWKGGDGRGLALVQMPLAGAGGANVDVCIALARTSPVSFSATALVNATVRPIRSIRASTSTRGPIGTGLKKDVCKSVEA